GASVFWFSDALAAFWYRASNSGSVRARIVEGLTEPISGFYEEGWLGFGTGSTHPGGAVLRSRLGLNAPLFAPPPAEAEPRRVLLELGPLGFICWYSIRFYLIRALWQTWRQLRLPLLRDLALGAFLVHSIELPGELV